ncbi:MAG: NAD-dependent protein deacetylase [Gemmatimonadota bacterium]
MISRVPEAGFAALVELLRGRRIVVLAGAGCSTESGIPDYRGPAGSLRRRAPIQYQEFVRSLEGRQRYWARSAVGWPRFTAARPNAAHRALAQLEAVGALRGVITQNVDGLHHAAGSRRVVELHGSLAWVRCLECGSRVRRAALQQRLLAMNVGWTERLRSAADAVRIESAPDGDAELPPAALTSFRVPDCADCRGLLKPDVVFFGENVPRERVDEAWRLFHEADVLLVVGSSLAVYSGRRFVYMARDTGLPVAVVNLGPTRADEMAAVKVEGSVGVLLPRLAEELGAPHTATLPAPRPFSKM